MTHVFSMKKRVVMAMILCIARTSAFSFAKSTAPSSTPVAGAVRRHAFGVQRYSQRAPTAAPTSFSSALYSTTQVEPELLSELAKDQLERRSFGGLSYLDTNTAPSKEEFFRVVFVLGGPGAGKGTQSELMVENYPTVHLSVGELLRNEQTKEDSPYREIIEQALVGGKIVPVEISLNLLQQAMREQSEKQIIYLVDGFPRNYDNLNGWCDVMHDVTALYSVLVYQCPLDVLEKRILKRAEDSGRSDDNLESLRKRFHTFEHDTMPIVDTLREASKGCTQWAVDDIRGDRPLEDVWGSTQEIMNRLILHDVVTANVALLDAVERQDVEAYQNLSASEWFDGKDAKEVLKVQEDETGSMSVADAKFEVITGKEASLSYTRSFEGQLVQEKRIWSHQGAKGWRCIHFARTPVAKTES